MSKSWQTAASTPWSAAQEWEAICRAMEAALRRREFEPAVLGAIEAVTRLLARHFPPRAGDRNELANRPVTV